MQNQNRLKIALQKKGRLHDDSIDLLDRCGLNINHYGQALLYHCKNLPIDLLFVRDDDIPTLICNRICDIGIVGENVLYEKFDPKDETILLQVIQQLGFGFCQLSIAIPKDHEFIFPHSMQNKCIATSYPRLLNEFLKINQINASIVPLSGSVEIAPRLEIADMICDLISSGQTLEANHLKPVTSLLTSQAVLIRSQQEFSAEKQNIFDLLLCRINGVLQAKNRKYIMFHAPIHALPAITQLLPGTESPTVLPLQGHDELVAVHVVSAEAVFWDTLENLKQVGASSILVLPIDKMLA